MNGQTQMSGQVPGRAQNQANQQFSGLSQHKVNAFSSSSSMHNYGAQIMDPELALARQNMQDKITQILQRRNSTMDLQRLPELAKRFEELIFKDAVSKEDYMSITSGSIEQRLHTIIKNTSNNNHPNSHHISSSSSISTMIPTPGMSYNGSTNSVIPSTDNSIMTTTAADMAANGPAGAVHNSLFNASDGSIHNNYQQSSANVCLGSGGNGMISPMGRSQQFSQMIPTPGLNNGLSVSDCSNGVEFSSISSMVPQQHQRYLGNHNSRILHTLGGQLGNGLRSNLHQRPSPYRFSNGISDGSVGPTRSNLQVVNGPVASEGYLNMVAYGSSPNLSRQRFDQQICQPTLPSEKHATNTSDLLGSENLYGPASSVASVITNQNTNPMSLHSKSISSHGLLTGTTNMQPMQQSPQLKSQMQDHSQRANLQSPKLTREHFMQPQHQIQNFQQQPNLPHAQFAQQQQEHQQQQLMSKTNTMRQSSMNSSFGGQVKLEHGIESHNEFLTPQASELFQLLELQNQYEQNISTGNHSKVPHLVRSLPEAQAFQQSFSQSSHQMLHLQKQVAESQNVYNGLFSGSQYDAVQKGTWHPQPPQKSQMPNDKTFEQLQEEFQLTGQVESQQSPFDGSVTGHAAAKSISAPQSSSAVAFRPAKSMCDNNYFQQRRWLLFLIHAQKCSDPKGTCKEVNCIKGQQLLKHIERCSTNQCEYPRCHRSKQLLGHCRNCDVVDCPVCIPVRDFLASHRRACKPVPDTCLSNKVTDPSSGGADSMVTMPDGVLFEASQGPQTSKRMKVQHTYPSIVPKKEYSPVVVSIHPLTQSHVTQDTQPQQADTAMCMKSEIVEMKTNSSIGFAQGNPPVFDNTMDEDVHTALTDVEVVPNGFVGDFKQETMLIEKENDQVKMEAKQEANVPASDLVPGSKTGKSKIKGVSLIELFTPEQIREHIVSLRQWIGQSKVKAEKNQAMERSMTENSCQLCAVEKLTFEPPPIYCTPCGARIKRNAAYYTIGSGDTRLFFCIPCYNEARGETIQVDGSTFPKVKLEKKKNDEETEEWWVQCDKCEAWQHQICALFNGRRNDGGRAEYTCPNCCIEEIGNRERKPLPQSTVLGAKDLPKTILSDHIEERLFRRLKLERQERARHMGKTFDEVPGAESLVVRVVSSVDKKLEVKQRFLEIFQEENYPTDFSYKSKVILLFQKIDGVEVCLFSMYVQEFGSECQFPNQRRVYLSYLDSVKYFRPEIRAVTGEALRTFVYHEILIGYLEYCKRRGFTSCYIWACPPLKGEDYILYCHPEIQKTPKSDKLREWYLSMLRKASKENIVVDLTNLYDHFFTSLGECKAKVTAARLPYFDGDYWPGAAEDMINQLRQEEDGRAQQKKGKTKKAFTKRALKAAGQTDLTGNASKDALLMQKLGETISSMKEDFIMVHLQHACTHCCLLMVSGTRWVCNQCKNFQLCDKCYDAEQRLDERGKHPINSREKHVFRPVQINDVSSDTKDRDEMLESEFFDTRQAFLSLCQGNHYQYDTLRRAKHSSMMVLYHLHNPSAPAFVTTCNVCLNDIETGQGWRCETCPEFDVCNACYQKEGCVDHPHKLINHPSIAERDAQNKEAREKRVRQLRNMLDLLLHASECRFAHCHYTNCRRVKALFRHGIRCPTRATGGCSLCKSMWNLLQLHARSCKVSNCCVPRCKDLKEHLRRLQQQSDSRRRAAVMEMMRQRAAEVAGSTE